MPSSPSESLLPTTTCPRCGMRFNCRPGGDCWCAAERYRLPLPEDAATATCLCPDCLRAVAATVP